MKKMSLRSLIIGMAATTAVGLASGASVAQDRNTNVFGADAGNSNGMSIKQARAELTDRLSQTGVMLKDRGGDLKVSADKALRIVNELSDERVMAVMALKSHAELEAAIFGSKASRDLLQSLIDKGMSTASIIKALGSTGSDLVFTPLTPCRIMDTRFGAAGFGALTANTDRSYDIDAADISNQTGGQTAGGCGIPTAARALSVNITVIGAGTGFLYHWPDLAALPNASIINWSPATAGPIANAAVLAILPSDPAAHIQASPAGTTGTHVLMDVLGYFAAPFQTALECVGVPMTGATGSQTGLRTVTAQCGAGYTVTGGSCDTSNSGAGPITGSRFAASNGWTCESNNYPGSTTAYSITGITRCCAVPGR
jgi:hypothetical protein